MADVTRRQEISLFSNFYPIIGPVKQILASQWPEKQVIGDFSKDSEQAVSSWVLNDFTGGLGVKEMDEKKHGNRFLQSGLNTDYPGHLFMPFQPLQAEEDPGAAESKFLVEFSALQYVVWSTLLVEVWNNSTAAFDTIGGGAHSVVATPTDAIVHKGQLYFACGSDFERYSGSAWASGTSLTGGAITARYFTEWDSKLFILDNSGNIKWSSDEGVTWTTVATSTLAAGSFTDLFTYRDDTGAIVIYIGTTTGLLMLDYDNAKYVDTELHFPANSNACKGSAVWRGAAYIPVGLTVYRYDVSSGPPVITPMGPGDTDYGLDSDYQGSIVRLLPELNHLYAVVRRSANPKYSQILRYNGKGWASFVAENGPTGTALSDNMDAACFSLANSTYRFWFYFNGAVLYINMPSDIYNALELPLATWPLQTANTDLITGWFDADASTINKTALRGNMSAVLKFQTPNTNSIVVAYGIDHDDSTWTTLGTASTSTTGETVLPFSWDFGSGAGIVFKSIRFRFRFNSESLTAPKASPDMHYFRFEYLKNIEPQWGFECLIDASKDHRHKRASTLVSNLKTAAETQTLGVFVFRTFQETSESYNVRIQDVSAATEAGRTKQGIYRVRLLAA